MTARSRRRGRPGAATGTVRVPELLRRPEVARHVAAFAAWSRRLVVAEIDADLRVVSASPGFANLVSDDRPAEGRSLNEFLRGAQARGPTFAVSRQGELPLPNLLWAPQVSAPYACCFYEIERGYLLVAEPQVVSDLELVDRMSELSEHLGRVLTEVRRENRKLQDAHQRATILMHSDPLTGLPNRRYFELRLAEAVSQAQRHRHPVSLVMADLDHFKAVNDRHGHDAGDRALHGFAEILRGLCRREDVPARFGGEEFLVLLPETGGQSASAFAERVRSVCAGGDLIGNGVTVTVSLGVSEYRPGEELEALLKRCDEALYSAKQAGRNRVMTYDEPEPATDLLGPVEPVGEVEDRADHS